LVLALRSREPGAFSLLYERHCDRVWRFLARLAPADAEDLFQETWLAAARHAHRLREDTQLLPWLFTVARNKHRNSLRAFARQARCRQELRAEAGSPQARVDDQAHARREAARTCVAFARLPAAYRDVLLLCVVEGCATAEVARMLACSEDTVRKRLSRARRELLWLRGREESAGDES
jgi:RNA polymerase sigma factor (sigma-70 family)